MNNFTAEVEKVRSITVMELKSLMIVIPILKKKLAV